MRRRSTESSKTERMFKNERVSCPCGCSWVGKRCKAVRHLMIRHDYSKDDAQVAVKMNTAHEHELAMA